MPRDSFLLRLDPDLLTALRRWADDDLRSVNGQIEFLLRRAVREAGRDKHRDDAEPDKARPKKEDRGKG